MKKFSNDAPAPAPTPAAGHAEPEKTSPAKVSSKKAPEPAHSSGTDDDDSGGDEDISSDSEEYSSDELPGTDLGTAVRHAESRLAAMRTALDMISRGGWLLVATPWPAAGQGRP